MSFAAFDGADNRDRLAGGELCAEADCLLRLPTSASSKREAAQCQHQAGGEFHDGQLASAAICHISLGTDREHKAQY